jgi:hypothetical protein
MLGITESSLTCIGRSHWTTNRSASSLDKWLSLLGPPFLTTNRSLRQPRAPRWLLANQQRRRA